MDEIQQIINPIVVGGGKRFFPEGLRLNLDLLEERTFSSGASAPGRSNMVIVAGKIYVDRSQRGSCLADCQEIISMARRASGCPDFHLSADALEGAA